MGVDDPSEYLRRKVAFWLGRKERALPCAGVLGERVLRVRGRA